MDKRLNHLNTLSHLSGEWILSVLGISPPAGALRTLPPSASSRAIGGLNGDSKQQMGKFRRPTANGDILWMDEILHHLGQMKQDLSMIKAIHQLPADANRILSKARVHSKPRPVDGI